MNFVDRTNEMKRLDRFQAARRGGLAVVWGRRRIGKTRLLLEWCRKHDGLYTVPDQSAAGIQRRYFSEALARRFPGMADVEYPDWPALLNRVAQEAARASWRGPLMIDEFPYLAAAAPELPSVVQRWIDHAVPQARLAVVLAGSSQRMMQGLVLHASSPLYGRASELFELKPLPAGYIRDALRLDSDRKAVEAYAAWGGIPRYWEVAEGYGPSLDDRVDQAVLDPLSPLHMEPDRLLLEEMPPATALRPILDAIGLGAHKLTEIAARLGQPATSFSRSLNRLQELGLIDKERPFGESEKTGKRILYKMADPFFRLWFRVVAAHRALLAEAPASVRIRLWQQAKPALLSQAWEELCRQSIPLLTGANVALADAGPWEPARRYWHGQGPEWDLAAWSADRKRLLLGEIKWTTGKNAAEAARQAADALLKKGIPPLDKENSAAIVRAVFVPEASRAMVAALRPIHVIDAATVLSCLR